VLLVARLAPCLSHSLSTASKLPPRLQAPLNLLVARSGTGYTQGVIADIGADHGILSQAILDKQAPSKDAHVHVHAVELSRLAYDTGIGQLQGHVEGLSTHLGDGLYVLVEQGLAVDAVVVTGIGAPGIRRIVNGAALRKVGCTQVIVQPWPPNLIPLLALHRSLEESGFLHHEQVITKHGKHVSITSSFVNAPSSTPSAASVPSGHGRGLEDTTQACSLHGVLSRWPLRRHLGNCSANVHDAILYRTYLQKNRVPLAAAMFHGYGGQVAVTAQELQLTVEELDSQLKEGEVH